MDLQGLVLLGLDLLGLDLLGLDLSGSDLLGLDLMGLDLPGFHWHWADGGWKSVTDPVYADSHRVTFNQNQSGGKRGKQTDPHL